MASSSGVEVIHSKGCSRLLSSVPMPLHSSSSSLPSASIMSRASPRVSSALAASARGSASGPFAGLVICVTGLSKEARKQVMEATERLGGEYSPSLHRQCTHLIVQSFNGHKYEHALKYGPKNGLFLVTLGWFIDSVRRNVRLSESLYSVKSGGENIVPMMEMIQLARYHGAENSCLPSMIFEESRHDQLQSRALPALRESETSTGFFLSNNYIYIDPHVSEELRVKVVEAVAPEGLEILDNWFVGCQACLVVCENPHTQRYIGHTLYLVTPSWILKTMKEKHIQKLVHLSTDISRHMALALECFQNANDKKYVEATSNLGMSLSNGTIIDTLALRQQTVKLAKVGVRNRRRHHMQPFQTPLRPITPCSLLDSICWSISEPTSVAGIYTDSCVADENPAAKSLNTQPNGRDSLSFVNFSRPLKESEKRELIFKNHFLTILFPIDRFGELGPSSKTFFEDGGFTCIQVLDHIYNFYQGNMTADEVAVAIHTDSRYADHLRALYTSEQSIDSGGVSLKRIDFLGSRKSFEGLKRVGGENNNNVYELVITA